MRLHSYLWLLWILLLAQGCGDDSSVVKAKADCQEEGVIPCGTIYTKDLLTVHKAATIRALRDYLLQKKNLRKNSPFRTVDDGNGDMGDILRGINLVKETYGINPIFALALSALESGWGKSCIARARNNLWGWNAVDGRPCYRVTKFKSFTAGFSLVFKHIKEKYIKEDGLYHRNCNPLEHFNRYVRRTGCPANYCGTTLAGMNCKYSSDSNWSNKVRANMNRITDFINKRCKELVTAPIVVKLPRTSIEPSFLADQISCH